MFLQMLIKEGSVGSDVGSLHQALIEDGFPIDAAETAAGSFGPSTKAAVEGFQHAHTGPDGHALGEDGIVGPFTAWALVHQGGGTAGMVAPGWRRADVEPQEVREVLAAAIADIGLREDPDGSNDGPELAKFHTSGEPWCAFAVSEWYKFASGGSPFGRIGGVYTLKEWGEKHGRVVPAGAPLAPGDVFILARIVALPDGSKRARGHTGLVVAQLDADRFASVEGNSSNRVRGLVRPIASITCFLRPLA